VCHETIYEAVYRGRIVVADRQALRTGRTYRHRRGRGRSRDGALKQLTNLRSIHERPAIVESRRQFGHWEGDLLIGAGQRSAIATLVERKARHTILVPLRGGHGAQLVGDGLIEAFTALPAGLRRTLTWDQGNEMFHHERIEAATGVRIYSWHQREHQRAVAPVLPQGQRPQRLQRRAPRRGRRRAQRPTPSLPQRPHATPTHATMDASHRHELIRNDG
jgi:IS30 family transposase